MDFFHENKEVNLHPLTGSNLIKVEKARSKQHKIKSTKRNQSFDLKLFSKCSGAPKRKSFKKKGKKNDFLGTHTVNCSKVLDNTVINNHYLNPESNIKGQCIKRPKSVIQRSMINTLELSHQPVDIKRHSNPSIIDKIIKKSLKKAKQKKIKQEKVNKLNVIINEIKKSELDYQNKQIRLQNSIKLGNKKKKGKKPKISPIPDSNNIYNLQTDTSNKIRKDEAHYLDKNKTNKRSVSAEDHYHIISHDFNLKKYIKHKQSKQKNEKKIEKIKEFAKKTVKLKELENLKKYIKNYNIKSSEKSLSSIDKSSEFSDNEQIHELVNVNKNISFIDDKSSEKSHDKEDYPDKPDKIYDENKLAYSLQFHYGDENYFDTEQHLEKELNIDKDYYFSIDTEEIAFILPITPSNNLKIETQQENISIFNMISKPLLKIQGFPSENIDNHRQKVSLFTENLLNQRINIAPNPHKKILQLEKISNISCKGKNLKQLSLLNQLENQFSWNYANIFLIEQLKNYELSDLKDLSLYVPKEKLEKLESSLDNKYSLLLNFLNLRVNRESSELLENLSLAEHKGFIQSVHDKKQCLHEILLESTEKELNAPLISNIYKQQEEYINEDIDYSSDDSCSAGISHSKSLKSLHEDNSIKSKSVPESANPLKNLENYHFFGFDDDQNKEFLNNLKNDFSNDPIEPAEKKNKVNKPIISILDLEKTIKIHENSFTNFDQIQAFIKKTLKEIDTAELLRKLSFPIYRDPLKELKKIEEIQIGEFIESELYNYPEVINRDLILQNTFKEISPEYNNNNMLNAERIHVKMILDVLNYFLQQFRPSGYKGLSYPWNKSADFSVKMLDIGQITEKILMDFEILCKYQLGNLQGAIGSIENDEMFLMYFKERQIERAIFQEAIDEEDRWTDYNLEETQIKLDISDIIVYDLVEEIINLQI